MGNKIEKKAVRTVRPDVAAILESASRLNPRLRARITLAPVSILRLPLDDEKTEKARKK